MTLAGSLHHVIHRGNNRQTVFTCTTDYQAFLACLQEYSRKFSVAVHAYVLMGNHFHILATPETADGLPHMMQAVGRRYARYFNDSHDRSGTLWEGRYKSTLIQAERYLLACMAYIDLNPVRADLASQASDYPWSSHAHYTGLHMDKVITAHPSLWQLGNTPFAREAAYATLVRSGVSDVLQLELTNSALGGWALGDADFVEDLQTKIQRPIAKRRAGRPVRARNDD